MSNHDQLLAKQLEKQERERMKQKEQADFQKLQAVYGMDNKGNYNQQTMTNLQEAVSSGQLTVYDYYEKIYEIKMAESKGLDTGASATRGTFLKNIFCLVLVKTMLYLSTKILRNKLTGNISYLFNPT